jgi:hypothetical protein
MLSFRAGRAATTLATPLIASLYGSSKLPTGDAGATDEPNSTIMAMLLSPLHVVFTSVSPTPRTLISRNARRHAEVRRLVRGRNEAPHGRAWEVLKWT